MKKTSIFIDGGYLNRILKNNFNAVVIDYRKLSEFISKSLELNNLRTYYYTCMPIRRKGNYVDGKRYIKMQKFLGNLRRLPRFEVKLGKLQLVGGQFKQKMVDVLMSIDIIKKSFGKEVKQIILIAGDADFVPAIKTAKDQDVIVHLFYHPSSVHNELLDEIDEPHIFSNDILSKIIKN